MDGPIVLYVDDNRDDLELAANAVRMGKTRFILKTALGAAEAMSWLEESGKFEKAGRPVLVLLDLKMPHLSGFELLRWMRERPAMRTLPVAVLTSSELREDAEHSLASGGNYFLSKPTEFKQLMALMAAVDDCIQEGAVDCMALRLLSGRPADLRNRT